MRKADIAQRLVMKRGLSEPEAAAYLSLSASHFRSLVQQGLMPRPRLAGRRRVFDVVELDAAFLDLPREAGPQPDRDGDSWADYE